ncbi:dienelactone hydrolase family protein [Planctomycetota bacterium]
MRRLLLLSACLLACARVDAAQGKKTPDPAVGVMSVIMGSKDFDIREGLPQNFTEARMVMNAVGAMSAKETKNGKPDVELMKLAGKYYADMARDPAFKDLPTALAPSLSGHTRPPCHYFLYVPKAYATAPKDKKWPMMVVLHGAGGNFKVGFPVIVKEAEARGYILVSPTYRMDGTWWKPEAVSFLKRVIEDVRGNYRVNAGRIALAGVSNGAAGAWAISRAESKLFHAVVSISGPFEGSPEPAATEGPPVYIVHGARDGVISVKFSRNAHKVLSKTRPGTEYREYPRAGHLVFFTQMEDILKHTFNWLSRRSDAGAAGEKK